MPEPVGLDKRRPRRAGRQRVVLHPGFHKTGTTSIARFLRANRALLAPYARLQFRRQMQPVLAAAREFSTARSPLQLEVFTRAFSGYLDSLRVGPRRVLVLTSEELFGHLPGRFDLADYRAAPKLAGAMVATLSRRFGATLDLAVLLTSRASAAWLRSAWVEQVKSSTCSLAFPEFATRFADAADLVGIGEAVRAAIAPWPLVVAPLETASSHPLGPAGALIDLLALPGEVRARLTPVPAQNTALDDATMQALREINRTVPGKQRRVALKHTLVAKARSVVDHRQ